MRRRVGSRCRNVTALARLDALPPSDLGVRIDDASSFKSNELLACLVIAEIDVVPEVFLAAFEHSTFFVERGDSSFKTRHVRVVAVGPDVLESNVADTGFGAAGPGRAVVRRFMLGGVVVALARREESCVLSFILRSQLASREVFLVRDVVGVLGGGVGIDLGVSALGRTRTGRHAAHA
eukprot:3439703-Pleurochrysis_carterae.AAC.1